MIDIEKLNYDKNGLIPAIIVDAETGAVLMLAYMNKDSLQISIDEGRTCFWSRSRNELWRKGETSGNMQSIVAIKADCDLDSLMIVVKKAGPACHTGSDTCFFNEVMGIDDCGGGTGGGGGCAGSGDGCTGSGGATPRFTLDTLYSVIMDRKANRKQGSYTTYLLDKGLDKILKKIGEESTEVVIAGKSGVKADTIYELSDLVYHALVLMADMGITPGDIIKELEGRHAPAPSTDETGGE